MNLRIVKYGEAVLREKAAPVKVVDESMLLLAQDMIDTMHKARGVGLAAQQVGRTERLCVVDVPSSCESEEDALFNSKIEMPLVLFNPEIIAREGSQTDKEGCLSFPGIGGSITRAREVTCSYVDETGRRRLATARGFLARALQHEIDHLDGILYVDHMSAVERLSYASKLKKLAKANGSVR